MKMSDPNRPLPTHNRSSRPRLRPRGGVALALALVGAALATVGCAKSPTRVMVTVNGDGTVPPFAIVRGSVARESSAPVYPALAVVSPSLGDTDAAPTPFTLPMDVLIPVPPSWSGPVTITIEGLDWDTNKILARGTTEATAVPEQTTNATLTLSAVPGGSTGDGGSDGAPGDDAAPDGGVGEDVDAGSEETDAATD